MRLLLLMAISVILSSNALREEGPCELLLKEANEKKHLRLQCHGQYIHSYLLDETVECFLNANKEKEAISVYANLNRNINDNSIFFYHGKWREKYRDLIKEIYTKEQITVEIEQSILTLEIINHFENQSISDIQFMKELGNCFAGSLTINVTLFENEFIIYPKEENIEEFSEKCYQFLLVNKLEDEFQQYFNQIWFSSKLIQEIVAK